MIYVRSICMPASSKAFCLASPDGGYDVYLSNRLSPSEARQALEHELSHIYSDDFKKRVKDAEEQNKGMQAPDTAEIVFCGSD